MLNRSNLHPYQERLVTRIVRDPAVFGIVGMGLGKTVATLTAIADLYDQCMISSVLVIAPLRVAQHVWPDEISGWEHIKHLTVSLILGPQDARRRAISRKADIHIINRENVPWLVTETGKRWPWDVVVIDESSSFKSTSAQRFKALKKIRPKVNRVTLLTGTPCPNSLLEMWPQMHLLDMGQRLGRTFTGFKERFFESDYMGYKFTPRPGAEKRIQDDIRDVCLSLSAEDYLRLPDRIERVTPVHLNLEQAGTYAQMENHYLTEIDGTQIDAMSAAVLCGKLQQLAQGAIYDADKQVHHLHDAKLDALEDLLEAAEGEPVLVAYTYRHDASRIRARFTHAVDVTEPGAIDRWNRGELPLMIAHPNSSGHGLNLQAGGHRIIWFGLTWSLEMWQQLNARLHRQGQTMPVIIHVLVTVGTIDEDILNALASKSAGQQALINAVKRRLPA